jgi:predicted Zn-dependent peptidase
VQKVLHEQYANGTQLVVIPMPASPTATVQVVYQVGSRDETPEINGISHALEHMMFRGTPTRANSKLISTEFERLGSVNNASTNYELTTYWAAAASQQWRKVADILTDMAQNSLFRPEDIAIEMGAIVEEICIYRDDPDSVCDNLEMAVTYGSHPVGRPILGSEANVLGFTRDKFVDYVQRMYSPANTLIVVAGNVVAREVRRYVEEAFAGIPSRPDLRVRTAVGPDDLGAARALHVCRSELTQAKLALTFPSFGVNDERGAARRLLGLCLGGMSSSRLFDEVREKRGWAYGINAGSSPHQQAGHFFVNAGLKLKHLTEAVEVIVGELAKAKQNGFTAEELETAKGYIAGVTAMRCETSQQLANRYANQVAVTGMIKTPEEEISEIESVTNDQIVAVAREIIRPEAMRLALVSPWDDPTPLLAMADRLG